MTAYQRVARVHVTDGVTLDASTYRDGRCTDDDVVELVMQSTWTAWPGTEQEAERHDRLELPYGVTVEELRALGQALTTLADDLVMLDVPADRPSLEPCAMLGCSMAARGPRPYGDGESACYAHGGRP